MLNFRCSGTSIPNIPVCLPEMTELVDSEEYCGLINDPTGPFGGCVANPDVPEEMYYTSCQYDVCALPNSPELAKSAACASLQSLAARCLYHGFTVLWRERSNCCMCICVG